MIRLIISAILILIGLFVMLTTLVSNFRFAYVLNRMQVAAVSDTLGATFIVAGLIVKVGFTLISLKLLLVIIFFWFAGPVASHFLARTDIISNEKILKECEVVRHDSL